MNSSVRHDFPRTAGAWLRLVDEPEGETRPTLRDDVEELIGKLDRRGWVDVGELVYATRGRSPAVRRVLEEALETLQGAESDRSKVTVERRSSGLRTKRTSRDRDTNTYRVRAFELRRAASLSEARLSASVDDAGDRANRALRAAQTNYSAAKQWLDGLRDFAQFADTLVSFHAGDGASDVGRAALGRFLVARNQSGIRSTKEEVTELMRDAGLSRNFLNVRLFGVRRSGLTDKRIAELIGREDMARYVAEIDEWLELKADAFGGAIQRPEKPRA